MKLLIDAKEIKQIAATYEGMSTKLLEATQTVRKDAWTTQTNSRDLTIRGTGETTVNIANRIETEAKGIADQAVELKDLANTIANENGACTPLKPITDVQWPKGICVMPTIKTPPVTPPATGTTSTKLWDCVYPPENPIAKASEAVQTVPDWKIPTGTATTEVSSDVGTGTGETGTTPAPVIVSNPTVVEQVKAALPPPKKKKKGLFGRIFGAIGNFFKGIWNKIKKVAKGLWENLKNTLKGIWTALKNLDFKTLLKWAVTIGASYFCPPLATAMRVFEAGKAVVRVAKNGIHSLGDVIGLVGGVAGVTKGLGSLGSTIGGTVGKTVTSISSKVSGVIGSVSKGASAALGKVGKGLADVAKTAAKSKGVLGTVGRVVGGAIDGVNKVVTTVTGWVDKVDAFGNKVIGKVTGGLRGVVDKVIGPTDPTQRTFGGFVKVLANDAINRGQNLVSTAWGTMTGAVKTAVTDIGGIITKPITSVQDQLVKVGAIPDPKTGEKTKPEDAAMNTAELIARITGNGTQFEALKSQITNAPAKIKAWTDYWKKQDEYLDRVIRGITTVKDEKGNDVPIAPPVAPKFESSTPAAAPAPTETSGGVTTSDIADTGASGEGETGSQTTPEAGTDLETPEADIETIDPAGNDASAGTSGTTTPSPAPADLHIAPLLPPPSLPNPLAAVTTATTPVGFNIPTINMPVWLRRLTREVTRPAGFSPYMGPSALPKLVTGFSRIRA